MVQYLEYLSLPTKIIIVIITVIVLMQIIGELIEFKGKAVPEFMKIRKYFSRKKKEREMLAKATAALARVEKSLAEFNEHYSHDNIAKRNDWITRVNSQLEQNKNQFEELTKKLDKNSANTLSILIENKRDTIINFAQIVSDENVHVTHEQFRRAFKIHREYEDILRENNEENGEVDVAFRIITEAYEIRMKNHSFLEDIRGYEN